MRRHRSPRDEQKVPFQTNDNTPSKLPTDDAASSNASRLPATLGLKQLFVGSALGVAFGGFFMTHMGLHHFARHLLLACFRAAAQLFLLGGLILQRLFGTTKPTIVWTWIIGVGLLAAQEASLHVEYTYDKLGRHMTFSVLTSGIGILSLALAGRVFGDIEPWFQPRTLIPVAGMLFGNTLPAVSLGASLLTRQFAQSSAQLELRLALGANSQEAVTPIGRHAHHSKFSSIGTDSYSQLTCCYRHCSDSRHDDRSSAVGAKSQSGCCISGAHFVSNHSDRLFDSTDNVELRVS